LSLASPREEKVGLILHGPGEPLLRRFYELRLKLWEAQGDVHPYRGRELRGLVLEAGFEQVDAFIYFSYGPRSASGPSAWVVQRTAGTSGT
jgi:hypothetical protein